MRARNERCPVKLTKVGRRQGDLGLSMVKDSATSKKNGTIRDRPGHGDIVQCRHHRAASLGKTTENCRNAFDFVGVLRRERLVEQQDTAARGIDLNQRPGQPHALLLSDGEIRQRSIDLGTEANPIHRGFDGQMTDSTTP